MGLPSFTKLGGKLASPSWLTSLSLQLMFPRVFDNDAVRATLSGLPSSSYSCLYSSDHSTSGTGYIGRADFDDIEGTWTDTGNYVHSQANQRETPHPVFDSANSRVNVYIHDDDSNAATYNNQHAELMTTTTLGTFSGNTDIMAYGHHTGYGQYIAPGHLGGSDWYSYHSMIGGECWVMGQSTSSNGTTYSLDQIWLSSQSHIAGAGYGFTASPFIYQADDGEWYWLTNRTTRPRLTGYPANVAAIVAVPIDITTLRPKGGYYTLVTPSGTTTDADYRIKNDFQAIKIGSTWYIVYVGVDNSGTQSICVAKSDSGSATQTSPVWPVRSDGELQRGSQETTQLSWDAVNDTLPGTLTLTATSGTNSSSHVASSYYDMKTGSGSAQDLRLQTASTYAPSSYETIEWSVTVLELNQSTISQCGYQFGLVDSLSNIDGVLVDWSSSVTDNQNGRMRIYSGHTNVANAPTYSYPLASTENLVANWARYSGNQIPGGLTLTLRLHNFGKQASVLINGHTQYTRNVNADGVGYGSGVFGYFRLYNLSTFPQMYARITAVTLKTYQVKAPAPNFRRTRFFVGR